MAESADGARKATVGIALGSFMLAFLAVLMMSVLTIVLFRKMGASELLAAAVASTYFTAIKFLHEKIEAALLVRSGRAPTRPPGPTASLPRMLAYGTFMIAGISVAMGGVMGVVVGIAGAAEESGRVGLLVPRGAQVFASQLLYSVIPVAVYLTGEWIGRRLPDRGKALLVALSSALGASLLFWMPIYLLGRDLVDQMLVAMSSEFGIGQLLPLGIGAQFAWYLLPLLIGALRGARYKPFFDLAFFARRLPHHAQEEIAGFIDLLGTEYAAKHAAQPAAGDA